VNAAVAHLPRAMAAIPFVLVVAGCVLLPSGPTVVTLRGTDGSYELPVALYDPGDLVETVEPAKPDTTGPDASLTVVGMDAAVLQWLGGACDARSQINVLAQGRTISMAVRTDETIGTGCTAIGIYRTVRITFREPIGDRVLDLVGAG
jgi:hypothetical protein